MTLNAPLCAQLVSGNVTANLTTELLDDVQMSNAAPGGYSSCSLQLRRPINLPAEQLSAYTTLEIIDTRSGESLWYGRLEDPGRQSTQLWQIGAVGAGSHALDYNLPVVYVDTRGDSWKRRETIVLPKGTFGVNTEQTAGANSTFDFAMPDGVVVPSNGRVVAIYELLLDSGQHVGALLATHDDGRTSTSFGVQAVGRGGSSADANLVTHTMSTTPQTVTARLGNEYSSLHRAVEMRIINVSGVTQTIAGDTTYSQWYDVRLIGSRVDALGNEITAAGTYSNGFVYSSDVVKDVLGRFCPEWDRVGSVIDDASPIPIYQLAYEDGATAQQVLEDVMAVDPAHYWGAWGNDYGRGAVFRWSAWPTEIGLSGLDTRRDAFDSPSSAADLFNQVSVRYKDLAGNSRTLLRSGACPALDAVGLTRRGLLDLGSQAGTAAGAAAAGDAFLDAHRYPTNSGTIKVSRPIVDNVTGRTLQPWQLRAGVLASVRNIYPRPDYSNESSDGTTVFRVSSVSYSAKSNEATLTLDSYNRTVARALARLRRASERTRRA